MTAIDHRDPREHGVRRITGGLRSLRSADRTTLALIAMPPGTSSIFAAIDRTLRARDTALVSVCAHRDEPANPLRGVEGSFACLTQLGRAWPSDRPLGETVEVEVLERCATLDARWWDQQSINAHLQRGARALHTILTRAVRRLRPESALVWAGPCSTFHAGAVILDQLGVPVRRIERGPIPRTLDLRAEEPWSLAPEALPCEASRRTASRIAEWLRRSDAEHWPRARAVRPRPCDVLLAPTIPPDLASMLTTWRSIASDCLLRGDSVVLRPHPNDPHTPEWRRLAGEIGVAIDEGAPLCAAIDTARLVITDSQSIRWTAAALETPCSHPHAADDPPETTLAAESLGAQLASRCCAVDPALLHAGVPSASAAAISLIPPNARVRPIPAPEAMAAPPAPRPASACPPASNAA